jgi:saccharopine dehydrogenase-like NADP-dependent oxidoreductase
VKGIDDKDTAMAQTVGLPLAIATKLVASGKIRARGVVLPITSEFYDPILAELSAYGITMNEVR